MFVLKLTIFLLAILNKDWKVQKIMSGKMLTCYDKKEEIGPRWKRIKHGL